MKKLFSLFVCLFVTMIAYADVLGEFSLEGTLDDKIPVKLKFCVNADEIAVGEIYYPKAKNPAPILVVGSMSEESGRCSLKEFAPDGTITGVMTFTIGSEGDDVILTNGIWTNPRTDKSFEMKNFHPNGEFFDVTDYLDYEAPQNNGREYVYSLYNPRYGAMMGGTVKFRGAGKNKLHFEVCNSPGNIAEGKSDPSRPAVLGETTHDYFYYENANECGYGFSAHFFKKFVVLKSVTGPDTYGCFGRGVTFEGVYMKVKQ